MNTRVYDMLVEEREQIAQVLAGLTPERLGRQSLCAEWTIHEVGAHLTTFLRCGQLKLYAGLLATAADLDRVNLTLTRWAARRSSERNIAILRRLAGARTTIPRSGYDPVLTDAVLHDLDIRRPLGIARALTEERLWVAFQHLTVKPSPGYTMGARLDGLRIEATDTGWSHGDGPVVRGPAESVILAISGRATAPGEVSGDGVDILRQRVTAGPKPGPLRRVWTATMVLLDPQPPDRRSRDAVSEPPPISQIAGS
ncbi:maleylpyruvate isomerase family mycothiol-dependent enzyme [Nonomuraea insulae]|uniref:Maleylpyruvate isomerase family mycothiol-dependent enzyme n=1 Tax=Nonomuraea insulae TaxID=1616787 RepID=A0ABW1CSC8_9ACTN